MRYQRFKDLVNLRKYWDWDNSNIQRIGLNIMNIIGDLDKCRLMIKM